jgi:hypothetical protein
MEIAMRRWTPCLLVCAFSLASPGLAQDSATEPPPIAATRTDGAIEARADGAVEAQADRVVETEAEPTSVDIPADDDDEAAAPPVFLFDLDDAPGDGTLGVPAVARGVPYAVAIGVQLFAQYALVFPSGADWSHTFDVTRGWLFAGFRVENAIGRVLLEGVRGANDGSLSGVAQDSLLVRVREAWAGYRVLDMLELRAGMIPTFIAPSLTGYWALRSVTRTPLREFDLIEPSDLGASARFELPERLGWIGAAYLNGEGYPSRDVNRGKNLEIAAEIHPLAPIPDALPLTLLLAYTNGSLGAGSARSDRLVGSLSWNGREIGVGASGAYLLGIAERGEREGTIVEAWARGELFGHLLLAAQFFHFVRNVSSGSDTLSQLTLTAGARVIDQLRVFLAVDGRFAGDEARVAVPGWERWQARLVVEGNFVGRFSGAIE